MIFKSKSFNVIFLSAVCSAWLSGCGGSSSSSESTIHSSYSSSTNTTNLPFTSNSSQYYSSSSSLGVINSNGSIKTNSMMPALMGKIDVENGSGIEYRNGIYKYTPVDSIRRIVVIENAVSDINENGLADTGEPYIPYLKTYTDFDFANPLTTFMVETQAYTGYNEDDMLLLLGLSEYKSLDFSKTGELEKPSNLSRVAMILNLANTHIYSKIENTTNQASSINNIGWNNTNSVSTGILPTTSLNPGATTSSISSSSSSLSVANTSSGGGLLPSTRDGVMDRSIYAHSEQEKYFVAIYKHLVSSYNSNKSPVVRMAEAVGSSINDSTIKSAIDMILKFDSNATFSQMNYSMVDTLNSINGLQYFSPYRDQVLRAK